jgi:PIN like domain
MASKKRRSNAPSPTPPPEPTFFADRNLTGRGFLSRLREAGLRIESHDDHFLPDTPDTVWLRSVGERRWIVLTQDRHIRYRAEETQALIEARATVILLVGQMPQIEWAENLIQAYPRICRFLARQRPPFIAKFHRPAPNSKTRDRGGLLELWLSGAAPRH